MQPGGLRHPDRCPRKFPPGPLNSRKESVAAAVEERCLAACSPRPRQAGLRLACAPLLASAEPGRGGRDPPDGQRPESSLGQRCPKVPRGRGLRLSGPRRRAEDAGACARQLPTGLPTPEWPRTSARPRTCPSAAHTCTHEQHGDPPPPLLRGAALERAPSPTAGPGTRPRPPRRPSGPRPGGAAGTPSASLVVTPRQHPSRSPAPLPKGPAR